MTLNLKKEHEKIFTSKFVGTGLSSNKKEFTGSRTHHWPIGYVHSNIHVDVMSKNYIKWHILISAFRLHKNSKGTLRNSFAILRKLCSFILAHTFVSDLATTYENIYRHCTNAMHREGH